MFRSRVITSLITIFCAVLYLGCFATTGLVLRPRPRQALVCPPSPKLKSFDIKTIAILPFEPSKKLEKGEYTPPYAKQAHQPLQKFYHLENDGTIVPDALEKAIIQTYRYKVADRRKIKDVIKEFELQQSGLVDEKALARIGKLTGADAVISGSVSMALAALQWQSYGDLVYAAYIGYISVNIRMTHIETGEVLWVCTIARNSLNYIDDPISISSMEDTGKLEKIGGVGHTDLVMFVLDKGFGEAMAMLP
jgi:hypothetical protein